MPMRSSTPRKDVATSFNRLRRMVDDIKSARKSLAAHHTLLAELVSVSLFSAVPSSKSSSPRRPPHLQLDDSQEVGTGFFPLGSSVPCSAPPSWKPAMSGPLSPPCNVHRDDLQEVGIGSPILQIDDFQEVGFASSILQGPIHYSVLPTVNPTLSSLRLPASTISASPTPSLPPSVWSGNSSPLSCKNLEEAGCVSNKIFIPLCQQITANPGKHATQPAFWASLLLVFLCFFLFTGKEVAVGITITTYLLTFKGRSFSKQVSRYMFPGSSTEFHSQDKEGTRLSRSSTGLKRVNDILLSFSESHSCSRSQSWPMLHGCAQQEVHTTEPGLSIYSAPSLTSLRNVGTHSARLKLFIMLVLALCGLAHGQIMAVCMCSCCVLMLSEMQRFVSKQCKQKIQYNILKDSLRQLST